MEWRVRRIRRRLKIPPDEPLHAWVMVDYQGLRNPAPELYPASPLPPCLALTGAALWLSNAGGSRRIALEDIVMASVAPTSPGDLRVDFMKDEPLLVHPLDDGTFLQKLISEIQTLDRRLQMQAPRAHGFPELPVEMVAAAEAERGWAAQLLAENGADPDYQRAALRHEAEAVEFIHEAQVAALRTLRTELLSGDS